MYALTQECTDDWWEVENLLDTAFAPGRTALSSYRLREGVGPVATLCIVARDGEGVLAGAIRFWPIMIGDDTRALLLGPIAVHPTRQGEGLGATLMAHALDEARVEGWQYVVLVGDEPYYSRFGFTRDLARDIDFPPPTISERVLAQSLQTGGCDAVHGRVRAWPKDQPVAP